MLESAGETAPIKLDYIPRQGEDVQFNPVSGIFSNHKGERAKVIDVMPVEKHEIPFYPGGVKVTLHFNEGQHEIDARADECVRVR